MKCIIIIIKKKEVEMEYLEDRGQIKLRAGTFNTKGNHFFWFHLFR